MKLILTLAISYFEMSISNKNMCECSLAENLVSLSSYYLSRLTNLFHIFIQYRKLPLKNTGICFYSDGVYSNLKTFKNH